MWGRVPTSISKAISVTIPNITPNHAKVPLTLQTNRLARLAPASAVLTTNTTTILATVAHSTSPQSSSTRQYSNPLLVDFRCKAAAVGVIPATWTRREQQPALFETLTARLIDRSLRPALLSVPSLPPTQITVSVLSAAKEADAPIDALAVNAAAAALAASTDTYPGPIAASRVSLIGDNIIPFPSDLQSENADLSVYTAINSARKILALSVHSKQRSIPESDVLHTIQEAVDAAANILPFLTTFRADVHNLRETEGYSSFPPQPQPSLHSPPVPDPSQETLDALHDAARVAYEAAFVECRCYPGKAHRASVMTRVQHDLLRQFVDLPTELVYAQINRAARTAHAAVLRRDGLRMDGRAYEEVRPIRCEAAVLPGDVHGSALFERGDTQVLACSTIGHKKQTRRTEEYADDATDSSENGLFVHYSFPPFATGEYGRFAASLNRREIGHSILTEKAISPLLRDEKGEDIDSFPYALRVSAEVLGSDGSSSMASVCAGSMAIMDAGGPLREPVAGIAMGLVLAKGGDAESKKVDDVILTDILGAEDHFGDMDMKVTGTSSGITACQLDVKEKDGVSVELVGKVLEKAKAGRGTILEHMLESGLDQPREMPDHAPRVLHVPINRDRGRNTLFRERFRGLRAISDVCNVYIRVNADGNQLTIEAPNKGAADTAKKLVKQATQEIRVGDIMMVKVVETKRNFAIVEGVHGCLSGLLHVSKMRLDDMETDGVKTTGGNSDWKADEQRKPAFLGGGALSTYPDVRQLMNVGNELRVCVIETDSMSTSLRFKISKPNDKGANPLRSEIDSIMSAVGAQQS